MRTTRYLAFVLAVGSMTALAGAQAAKTHRLKGWISDSQCGASNHSRSCVTKCIKNGSKPVFVDSSKKVWSINDPSVVKSKFYGEHVDVVATKDTSNNSIHINKIKKAHTL
jgi:hypothetical protein